MVSAASVHSNKRLYRRNFPSCGCNGKLANKWPNRVRDLSARRAPRLTNVHIAESVVLLSGGSGARPRVSAMSWNPIALTCKHKFSTWVRCISGACVSKKSLSYWTDENKAKYFPARQRPARPFRWHAFDRAIHWVRKEEIFVSGSKPMSLSRPESITYTTSSIVIEDSAIFVVTTIFRWPLGGCSKTRCCSCCESEECSGNIIHDADLLELRSLVIICRISANPGMKIKTAPLAPASIKSRSSFSSIRSTSFAMSSMSIHSHGANIKSFNVSCLALC
mmetsp:Transcript_70996/g.184317  ORF Transcript_70996/g.184317 Transcript_70996/m.184317 type:complete len:278 (-) Transcript_70996:1908-2741(-)